jgi:hypothetical protein
VRGGKIGGFGMNATGKSDILTNRSAPPSPLMLFSFTSEQKQSVLWRATGVTTTLTTTRPGFNSSHRHRQSAREAQIIANLAIAFLNGLARPRAAGFKLALHMRLHPQYMNRCFYRQS